LHHKNIVTFPVFSKSKVIWPSVPPLVAFHTFLFELVNSIILMISKKILHVNQIYCFFLLKSSKLFEWNVRFGNTKINTNNLKLNLSSRSFLCMISEKKSKLNGNTSQICSWSDDDDSYIIKFEKLQHV
jgi:hypothetical protein